MMFHHKTANSKLGSSDAMGIHVSKSLANHGVKHRDLRVAKLIRLGLLRSGLLPPHVLHGDLYRF